MDRLFSMVEGRASSEISVIDQIDQNISKEFLSKSSVWDFYEMNREEYSNKDSDQKQYFNH